MTKGRHVKSPHCTGRVLPDIKSHHTYIHSCIPSYTVNLQHLAFILSQIGKEWAMCMFCFGIGQYLVLSTAVLLPIKGDIAAYHCIPLATLLSASYQHKLCLECQPFPKYETRQLVHNTLWLPLKLTSRWIYSKKSCTLLNYW